MATKEVEYFDYLQLFSDQTFMPENISKRQLVQRSVFTTPRFRKLTIASNTDPRQSESHQRPLLMAD